MDSKQKQTDNKQIKTNLSENDSKELSLPTLIEERRFDPSSIYPNSMKSINHLKYRNNHGPSINDS